MRIKSFKKLVLIKEYFRILTVIFLVVFALASCDTESEHKPFFPISQVPKPFITPAEGIYPEVLTITITCEYNEVDIRYTLDGSLPTKNSIPYELSFYLYESATVKARAFYENLLDSEVVSSSYIILNSKD